MKKLSTQRRQIALMLCIAMLCGLFFEPMANVASADGTEEIKAGTIESAETDSVAATQNILSAEESRSGKGMETTTSPTFSGGTVSPTPEAATITTPGATIRPTATTKPTANPYMTPNPNATLRLGDSTQDVKMIVGDKGVLDIDWTNTTEFPEDTLDKITQIKYESNDESILSVSENGQYEAKAPGKVTLYVDGDCTWYGDWYGDWYSSSFFVSYTVIVYPDMTNVTLDKDSATIYLVEGSYYYDSEVEIKILSDTIIDYNYDFDDEEVLSVVSENEDMYVSASLSENKITISCNDTGTTKLTITIYGKAYTFILKVVSVSISDTSLLLAKKQTKKIKLKGNVGKVVWKSSRKKVATVSANGKIKAKKEGNTIISAKIGDCKIGCVVSVTNARKKKAIKRAVKIASTSKYSQAKRMQKGFYDCSSLTWRSYSKFGYSLGGSGYAPVAASQAQWLAQKKKLVKGGLSQKNIENLKLNAGDLYFETGAKNGRYKGIYHVEMIIGYELYGFDSDGDPIVVTKWANRSDGYYGYGGGIVGRP